jgi:3-methylcrotonyl-CoA carboxylase alpha subunit
MFKTLLIANRGEIAVRIARTAKRLGIRTVAVYSDADRNALHVACADEAFCIGAAPASQSYLDGERIIAVAQRAGAEAIHPGYGFLAENPEFAEAVTAVGLVLVGPPAAAIRAMGLKDEAKRLMAKAGVPLLPGYDGDDRSAEHLAREAARIGFPVLLKPVAGGGGKGMRRVDGAADFASALESARREALSAFGDDRVLIEKFLPAARHIEVQIFADAHGNALHLFERDCSLQRRHQKVIEESPAPGVSEEMRRKMGEAAVAAARAVAYAGAGTIEFIADVAQGLSADRFYFMEMNTRLQVEHPVTEMVTGLDLVEWQLRVASGEALPLTQEEVKAHGHAVEARLYAEDPAQAFQPQTGTLARLEFPGAAGLRVDAGVRAGDAVTPYYDPMIAKLIAHGPTRAAALATLSQALATTRTEGVRTNRAFLHRLLAHGEVAAGNVDTALIEREIAVLAAPRPAPAEAVAAALLAWGGHLSVPKSDSPFATLKGFRLWGAEPRRHEFDVDAVRREAALEVRDGSHFRLHLDGRQLDVRLLAFDRGSARLEIDGRLVEVGHFRHDDAVSVAVEGESHEFRLVGAAAVTEEEEEASNVVVAAAPGLVTVLRVKPGDCVEKGETVAVTEAMKMEFALRAPRAGRIASVHVAEGDRVQEGAVVIRLADEDA